MTELFLLAVLSGAAPDAVPEPLRPWTNWVLHGEEQQMCPELLMTAGTRLCRWPGRLELKLDDRGGTFSQQFHVYGKEQWLPLPGDERRWPLSVKVDGKEAIVAPRQVQTIDQAQQAEAPAQPGQGAAVLLSPGSHLVTGTFEWAELPESLSVPSSTALLDLAVRGRSIAQPTREADGRLFLQKEAAAGAVEENLEVRVYRLVTDDVPLTLTTRVELSVSGKGREVLLGRALPQGFVPMSLLASAPARVEPDGRLRLQVRAGDFWVELVARHDGPVAALRRPEPSGLWPDDEIWSFGSRPHLRQVLVENVSAVDPTQTTLPAAWKQLPSYAMGLKDEMKLTERRRGDQDPAPDRLSLTRTIWLDFDGRGYTVNDRISGSLHRSWRLSMPPPAELGRVVASGSDQLVSRLAADEHPGVELREGIINLEADSRIVGSPHRLSAVSWDADFQHVGGVLNLPPGWKLFYATGVDSVSSTWVHNWTLLDIFVVLVTAIAVGRLFGWTFGALALAALALSYPEPGAPHFVWLAALAGEALVRVLPKGAVLSVARLYRFAAWAALAVLALVFAVQHVRQGMYPALEHGAQLGGVQDYTSYNTDNLAQLARSSSGSGQGMGYGLNDGVKGWKSDEGFAEQNVIDNVNNAVGHAQREQAPQQKAGKFKGRSFNPQDYDKSAIVQTGPGLPRWTWNQVNLGFSGPVERGQQIGLWLMSPALNLVLAWLRVLLLGALALVVFNLKPKWPGRVPSAGAAVLLLLCLLPVAAHAQAMPTPEMLGELKARLLERPDCAPNCASSPRLFLDATPTTLRLRIEVHAADSVGVPLPADDQQWMPRTVLLDGRVAPLLRDERNRVVAAVEKGAHELVLEGPLPARETVQLPLPLKSHRVQAKLDGWSLDGLHEDGLADDTLQLTRQKGKADATTPLQSTSLPAFVTVERELTLGQRWTVQTTVRRLTPPGAAVVLEVPLLPGESVTTQDVRVNAGKASVNMGPQVTELAWASTLEEQSPLELVAPSGLPWTEVWRLDLSPVWHVSWSGIPNVHQQDSTGARIPEWRPWPGEKVSFEARRPEGVKGQTLTIDQSRLSVRPGPRATDVSLTANLRSSRGGQHVFTLPDDAVLQSVTINGATQPIRQEGRRVAIPLAPGSQSVVLTFRQSVGVGSFWRTPEVDMGAPSANADLEVQLSKERWVLWAGGPRMGPSVLFWSFLLVLFLLSIGLGRIPWTPLRFWHWMLLMIGLSQVPIPAGAVVVGWLLAMGWRQKVVELGPALFNLRQLALFGWAIGAAAVLMAAIYGGLLGAPEMQVRGNGSHASLLRWFDDRTEGQYPVGWVFSAPMLLYRAVMLAWSLSLSLALLRWLKWAWSAFGAGGLWRRSPPPAPKPNG